MVSCQHSSFCARLSVHFGDLVFEATPQRELTGGLGSSPVWDFANWELLVIDTHDDSHRLQALSSS